MERLRILASGDSSQARSHNRGKLFEKLMTEVLRRYGYGIDRIHNVNYAGMEIDIEGKAFIADIPLYAECKCYDTEIDSPKFQAFFGKYTAKWFKDNRCVGLFIALPGINSYAKGFYRDYCEGNQEITIKLLEEEAVLESIFDCKSAVRPEHVSSTIDKQMGTPGDLDLLYTDKGLFWVQYVIPPNSGISSRVCILDAFGRVMAERATLEYLAQLYPGLEAFEKIEVSATGILQGSRDQLDAEEEIVEVRGSSACFEYQFPASPEYFVGRQSTLEDLGNFAGEVIRKETSSRGVLFEANSGWGKSSLVLAGVARLKEMGHLALAIDSRSASSSQFILRVIDYALKKFGEDDTRLSDENFPKTLSGFESALNVVVKAGRTLEADGKVMFIFLDQFENLFFLPEALKRVRDLLLRVCDSQTNVVIGFSWKTDLVGLTSEFPYDLRDAIIGSSKRIALVTFSELETTALLDRLGKELRAPLRKDLKFFLSEFSQGYPWLLKRLCAHVKAQREQGIPQSEIANSLLNVEELFRKDLQGLSPEQEDALRRIAKAAPISISKLGEEFKPDVVKSLVNARLVVRIGKSKYDVYWDIFRDYLNSGRVPIQENYILRTQKGSVVAATKLLAEAGGALDVVDFQHRAQLSEKSLYNVARDLRLLGLANIDEGRVILQVPLARDMKGVTESLRTYLQDRLPRNRLVWRVKETLESEASLSIEAIASLLSASCPYISATKQTWRTYARQFADWMDFADLAVFDAQDGTLVGFQPGTNVSDRHFQIKRRARGKVIRPMTQSAPIEQAAIRLVQLQRGEHVDFSSFKRTTFAKAVASLEDLEFITINRRSRKPASLKVLPTCVEFVLCPEKRSAIFAEKALRIESFATFVGILREQPGKRQGLAELGKEITTRLNLDWTIATAETNAKIMLDWARYAGLAPGVFAYNRRRRSVSGGKGA